MTLEIETSPEKIYLVKKGREENMKKYNPLRAGAAAARLTRRLGCPFLYGLEPALDCWACGVGRGSLYAAYVWTLCITRVEWF